MLSQIHVDRLDALVRKYSYNCFRRSNKPNQHYRRDGSPKPLKPYGLDYDAEEALKMYKFTLNAVQTGEYTKDDEARVKRYLLDHFKDIDFDDTSKEA